MAEFQEVMRQASRMCKAIARCGECPVGECFEDSCPMSQMADVADEFENGVMDWADRHPEHVYPSWQEAWKQLFPNGQCSPCPAAYDIEFEPEDCAEISCAECKARHMHAKVAEKLGIKPVEVRRDA